LLRPTRPLISIVIPTYNLADYITQCLDTITNQSFRDIEIVVVDGGSDDQTRTLLEVRRRTEPRLTLSYHGRIGPGNARNEGVRLAVGEYIWFVDGDDVISPECLATISKALRAERPDLLVVNHAILYGSGTLVPGQDSKLIAAVGAATLTLADWPRLLDLSVVSWNKIVRREFLAAVGTMFLPTWPHEDVPVSCDLLLAAQRLSVLPHVCYYYRRARSGSAMKTGHVQRHFAIFDAWRPVLNWARDQMNSGAAVVTREIYHRLFQRAIWHYSLILDADGYEVGILGRGGFVARPDRRAYFEMMSRQYADYVPVGYRRPKGLRGVKFLLIRGNAYRVYSALDPINRWRWDVVDASRFIAAAAARLWSGRRQAGRHERKL
jgi:CDP-glycerol glycerophosphotransferase